MSHTTAVNPWRGLVPIEVVQPDGLDTLTAVLVALQEGAPVPQRAAEHLAHALRPCLDGDNDIAARLGLRAPRVGGAHETPVALTKKIGRDELVRAVMSDMSKNGGVIGHSAHALAILWLHYYLSDADEKACRALSKNGALIFELAKKYGKPLSYRQILRIYKGEPAYNKVCKK